MQRSAFLSASKNEAARIRPVIWILLDDSTRVKHLQNFVNGNAAQWLRFHLPTGVICKATALDALTNRIIVHAAFALLHASDDASVQWEGTIVADVSPKCISGSVACRSDGCWCAPTYSTAMNAPRREFRMFPIFRPSCPQFAGWILNGFGGALVRSPIKCQYTCYTDEWLQSLEKASVVAYCPQINDGVLYRQKLADPTLTRARLDCIEPHQ